MAIGNLYYIVFSLFFWEEEPIAKWWWGLRMENIIPRVSCGRVYIPFQWRWGIRLAWQLVEPFLINHVNLVVITSIHVPINFQIIVTIGDYFITSL